MFNQYNPSSSSSSAIAMPEIDYNAEFDKNYRKLNALIENRNALMRDKDMHAFREGKYYGGDSHYDKRVTKERDLIMEKEISLDKGICQLSNVLMVLNERRSLSILPSARANDGPPEYTKTLQPEYNDSIKALKF